MDILNDYRVGSLNQTEVKTVKDNGRLSQEDFLKIIAANISNPPIPGSGSEGGGSQTDFVGQMVQMNLLEQVTDLTASIQSTMLMTHQQQALSLVGKEVSIAGKDDEVITGIVEKIKFKPDGMATIQVDGKEYFLQNVTEVREAGKSEVEEDAE